MGIMNGLRQISRSQKKVQNVIGYISMAGADREKKFRKSELEKFDSYYESRQYDHLPSWDLSVDVNGNHIPVRKRQPRFKVGFAKSLSQRVVSKLIGDDRFPSLLVADSPDDQEFLKAVIRESKLKSRILEPLRRCINTGSVFVRFYLTGGAMKVDWTAAKYCYPTFTDSGELENLTIKYVYDDPEEKDHTGAPKRRWYRMDLGQNSEILFDNPEYVEGQEPQFEEVQRVDHNLGFVQGEWFRTCEIPDSADGYGLTEDIMDFIDELNYSLSQSSQAVSYNQDPQLTLKNMDEAEAEVLIRSASKSWMLGREGEASFLETNLGGVERAIELRDKVRMNIQDISRVVLLDPEKIVGSAQSAKAMEVLHGPLVDLVNELRPAIGDSLKNLVLKMALTILISNRNKIEVPVVIPPGYVPQSFQVDVSWNPIFQQTMTDLKEKVAVASLAASSNLISRRTLTKWLAKDFGVEDVDAEIQEVNTQVVINPFAGGF